MDPTVIVNPAAIPPGTLGLFLEPAALFTVWIGLVVVVVASLCAFLGMEGRSAGDEDVKLHLLTSRHREDRAAA